MINGVWWPFTPTDPYRMAAEADELIAAALTHVVNKDVAIDVGAFNGIWAARLAETFQKVWALEPEWEAFRCLVRNQGGYFPLPIAAWDKIERVSLAKSGSFSHVISGMDSVAMPLDLLFSRVDLIKIDVEGAEAKVLDGASRAVREYGPVIIVEDKGYGLRYGIKSAREYMATIGYKEVYRGRIDSVWAR